MKLKEFLEEASAAVEAVVEKFGEDATTNAALFLLICLGAAKEAFETGESFATLGVRMDQIVKAGSAAKASS